MSLLGSSWPCFTNTVSFQTIWDWTNFGVHELTQPKISLNLCNSNNLIFYVFLFFTFQNCFSFRKDDSVKFSQVFIPRLFTKTVRMQVISGPGSWNPNRPEAWYPFFSGNFCIFLIQIIIFLYFILEPSPRNIHAHILLTKKVKSPTWFD